MTRQEEVDRNFAFFSAELPNLLIHQRGRFALIREQKIIGFYDTALDALTSAQQLYGDGLFSIQKVSEEVIDLGFFSHAMHLGTT